MDKIKWRPRMGHYFNNLRCDIFNLAAYSIIIRRPPSHTPTLPCGNYVLQRKSLHHNQLLAKFVIQL